MPSDPGPGGCMSAEAVCQKAGIPEPFTRKALQALVQGGVLKAVRGPGGGYLLKNPPGKTTLGCVIQAIDGKENLDRCVMGFPVCNVDNPCPLHGSWETVKRDLLSQLDERTLQDLAYVNPDEENNEPEIRKEKA